MTDEQIIKALECCRDDERYNTCEYCLKCPVSNYNLDEETEAVNCVDALLTRAIDLIKRKEAEIERLKDFCDIYSNEGERAIKEFAERLKKKAFKPLGTWFNEKVVTENCIDNLVKEMVGENNG